ANWTSSRRPSRPDVPELMGSNASPGASPASTTVGPYRPNDPSSESSQDQCTTSDGTSSQRALARCPGPESARDEMLRNMKLGTKLLAVVLPPLLVLVAVAGVGAKDRLDEASRARHAENYIELAAATSAMITTLQWERTVSLYLLATGDGEE